MSRHITSLIAAVAGIAALAMTGCAALNTVATDVTSFSKWSAGRMPATYAFERLPSQRAAPQQAQMLEDAARRAVEHAGFVADAPGAAPDVTIQLALRTRRSSTRLLMIRFGTARGSAARIGTAATAGPFGDPGGVRGGATAT